MLRTLHLAKRSSLLLLVAGTLATGLSAQHPVITPGINQIGDEINFSLSNPTSGGTRRAFLACYFALEGGGGNLTKALKKSVGAVAPYSSTDPNVPAFEIPNANTTTANAIPNAEFTVPPGIIAHAINDVNFAHSSEFMHTFSGSMAWTSTGLGGANSGAALNWPGFEASTWIPCTTFNTDLLARALVARQIGYVDNLPPTDVSVVTRANAIVDMCALDAQLVSFNAVLVEVQELPSSTEPVKIKLSKSKKVTLQLPGTGNNGILWYHCGGVAPVYPYYYFEAAMHEPGFHHGDLHQIYVPTTAGYVALDMELRMAGTTPMLGVELPGNVTGGEFMIVNTATMQAALMDNGSLDNPLPVVSNFFSWAPHSQSYAPIPMPTMGT